MDLSGFASLSTALSQTRAGDTQAILVQKKAMDMEAKNAQALLETVPQVANNPAHLGQTIDVKA